MISKIEILFVEHGEQRYPTAGDWYFDDTTLVIKVSKTGDARSDMAVARHELDEAILCTLEGVTPQMVDEFDMHNGAMYDEPGKHPSAPYHRQHLYATAGERRFIETMGVSWEQHGKNVDNLDREKDNGNETPNA